MDEFKKIVAELLIEMNDMSPEDIEEIRTIWLKEIKKPEELEKRFPKVEKFVNLVCDIAIDRAKRKLEIA